MKQLFAIILCLCVPLAMCGCQDAKTRAAEGAIIGTVLGAGAGYVIGKQSGHGAEGAGIGAAVGALGGAAVGSQINKPGTQQSQATTNQMTIQQIVDMTRQGVNEAVIIDRIRLSGSKFNLTSADIDYLKQQGVGEAVIQAMQVK
ncbi:MAG: glycine zipper 2TM domain-containing protein [Candidatus Omnitrophica bacterium]|nr:glycine zipper 2TM domain-containing protein [Candidatus Omnitrophota bacterium]